MGEQDRFQVERRMNAAITIEAGNGPGRWIEVESQDALGRLDARLNPDHGSAGPANVDDRGDALEHRALIAFSERQDTAVDTDDATARLAAVNAFFESADGAVDEPGDATQTSWGEIQPTAF
jgi:hypothetical protein